MSEAPPPISDLQQALSLSVARVLRDYYGRGPAQTRAYLFDEFVFVVADDVLTPLEQRFTAAGDIEMVREVRVAFEDLMTKSFVGEVEKLTGRTVLAYHSQLMPERESLLEIFVLDAAQDGLAPPPGPIEVAKGSTPAGPGHVGDADELPTSGERRPPRGGGTLAAPRQRGDASGAMRAAIGSAVTAVYANAIGRGPARARVFIADEHVFCALHDPLTTVEGTLSAGGRENLVRRLRGRFVVHYGDELDAALEGVTGARVVDRQTQVVFSPDIQFIAFRLDREVATD